MTLVASRRDIFMGRLPDKNASFVRLWSGMVQEKRERAVGFFASPIRRSFGQASKVEVVPKGEIEPPILWSRPYVCA
jgi:hypothetical protein